MFVSCKNTSGFIILLAGLAIQCRPIVILEVFQNIGGKEFATLCSLALLAFIKLWIFWRAASCATFLADQLISSVLVISSLSLCPVGGREKFFACAAFQLYFDRARARSRCGSRGRANVRIL